jgi:hypothetical protein
MTTPNLFTSYLTALGVPFTPEASAKAFDGMSFKSLFGLSRLLTSYGIENQALQLADISQLRQIPTPFMAQTAGGFVVVESISPDGYTFSSKNGKQTVETADFEDDATGIVLLAYPDDNSAEPDYASHRFYSLAAKAKLWVLVLCAAALLVYGFVASRLWSNLSTVLLVLVDFAGIGVTWLLILKSLKVSSKSADSLCGILKEHGCDTVLEQKASKFFGLFGWSEVGFAYFTVCTALLFIFPQHIGCLALINGCCLPFTVWSIWYQRFRLHTWCTLCVMTQCILWLQFLCYFFGGWWHYAFPLSVPFFAMAAAFVVALLTLNRIVTFIEKRTAE